MRNLLQRLRRIALLALLPAAALAQEGWPSRPVELVVPYGAGGSVDVMARLFADLASKRSGQPWTVVNRSGAAGLVGLATVANARADGHVLAFSPASPLTNSPFVTARMPFDARQIAPVCQVFENTFAVVVRQDSPVQSLAALIAASKGNAAGLAYGHAGPASIPHLAVAALEQASGARFESIPYRTDGAIWNDLFGGSLAFVAQPVSSVAGKPVRVLAVLADRRHPAVPDAPSVKELGYPALSPGLNGLFMPRGAPPQLLAAVERLCEAVVRSDEFARAAGQAGQAPAHLPRPAFESRIERTLEANARLVPALHLEKN